MGGSITGRCSAKYPEYDGPRVSTGDEKRPTAIGLHQPRPLGQQTYNHHRRSESATTTMCNRPCHEHTNATDNIVGIVPHAQEESEYNIQQGGRRLATDDKPHAHINASSLRG